jgi:tetratricopeptide (TPR) repeat protein
VKRQEEGVVAQDPFPPDDTGTTHDTVSSPAVESSLPPGALLTGRYTVLSLLGRGAMGAVYAAYDATLDRRVAVKLLHSPAGAADSDKPNKAELRLLREAHAMARINHPNVVTVYDVGQLGDGQVFLALELVEGATLQQWLRSSPREWRTILDVFLGAARGLDAVHAAGLVHRDFKPANVLVGSDGRARVTDFGIVRMHHEPIEPVAAEKTPATRAGSSPDWAALTEAGTIAGTPRYMAPEIFEGNPADVRSDIYSFCLALYEALYRRHPFADDLTNTAPLDAPTRDVTLPPSSSVPAWVGRAVVAGLRVEPAARTQSMREVIAALERDPREERQRRVVGLGVGGVVLLLGVLLLFVVRAQHLNKLQLCQGADQQLAGIWDAAAQKRVEQSLLATGQPFAANTWRNLRETLDRYAVAWIVMHRDSCVATRLRRDQSEAVMTLRMACLDKRRQSLAAVVDVLAHADATVVERAERAATGLPSVDHCGDVPALLDDVPPPEDRAVQARVRDVRARLAQAAPLRLAGKTAAATALADGALNDARKLDYPPVLAEALLESGRTRMEEAPAPADPLLTEAAWTAQAHRDDRTAAAAAVALVNVYAHMDRPSEWQMWQGYARAALLRIGGDEGLEAELWSAQGYRNHDQGHFADAYANFDRAAQLMRRHYGARDVRALEEEGYALTELTNMGKRDEARARKVQLAARTEELLGPHHPQLARMLISVGFSNSFLGNLAEAQAAIDRAAAILHDLGESYSTRWLFWYEAASYLALLRGRYSLAEAISARGLEGIEPTGLGGTVSAQNLLCRLAVARTRLGRGAQGIALITDELHRAGDYDARLAQLSAALADIYEMSGRADDALTMRERYLRLERARNPEDSRVVGEARLELDRSLASVRPADVLANQATYERLLAGDGPQSSVALTVHMVRGEAQLALGHAAPAADELATAVRIADAAGYDPNLRARLRGTLARARWAMDARSPAAATLVAEAEHDYDSAERADPLARAELRQWARAHRMADAADRR